MNDPLIGAARLRDDLAEDPAAYAVLDVQFTLGDPEAGARLFAQGHLPGARHLDLDADLAEPVGDGSRGRHPLPAPERVADALARCGVAEGQTVVAYDGRDGHAAARAWWVLTNLGLQDVRVLDGGLEAWRRDGGEVATGAPEPIAAPGNPPHLTPGMQPLLTADEVEPFLLGKGVLLDARAPERYRGEQEPMDPVAGHIPGAVNSPAADLVHDDGTMRPPEEIRARWETVSRHGRPEAVAVYCGSGVTAAHHVLALARIGIPAGLYAGSWSEWVADPSRPVATGPTPR